MAKLIHLPRLTKRLSQGLFVLFALAAWVLVIYRSATIPLFSDEVSSFFRFIQTGDTFPFKDIPDSNNHFLNSVLGRLSYQVFGAEPWAIRLPNTLSFLLFVVYLYRIGNRFGAVEALVLLLLSIASLFFLSFFSLARGYGMSMAFFTAAVYHSLRLSDTKSRKHLFLCLIFSMLALWANLSLMVTILLLGILSLFYRYRKVLPSREYLLDAIGLIPLLLFPLGSAVVLAFRLKSVNGLYYGSSESFYDAIILRFSEEVGFGFAHPEWAALAFVVLALIALVLAIIKRQLTSDLLILHLLFWGNLVGLFLMRQLLGVLYPMDRALLHLYLLFILLLVITVRRGFGGGGVLVSLGFFILLLPHFQQPVVFGHTPHWRNEHVRMAFLEEAKSWSEKHGRLPALSAHGLNGRVWDYNDFIRDTSICSYQENGYPSPAADLILTYEWQRSYPHSNYDTLYSDADRRIALLKRRTYSRVMEWPKQALDPKEENGQGAVLSTIKTDTLDRKYAQVELELVMQSPAFPYRGKLRIRALDSLDHEISAGYIQLDRVEPDIQKAYNYRRTMYIDLNGADHVELELLNVYGQPNRILGGQVKWRLFD